MGAPAHRACPALAWRCPGLQITHFKGQRVAAEIPVWNPSFDVTPAALIEGIITERGLVPRQQPAAGAAAAGAAAAGAAGSNGSGGSGGGSFAVRSWLAAAANGSNGKQAAAAAPVAPPLPTLPGFRALDCSSIVDYLAGRPELAKHVGSPDSKASWIGESRLVGWAGAVVCCFGLLCLLVSIAGSPACLCWLCDVTPPAISMPCPALPCTALHCTALHCTPCTAPRSPICLYPLPACALQCARWATATSTLST